MNTELKQAAEQALKELGEARKIIRASSSRQLAKDWDRRATDALANLRIAIQQPEPVVDVRCEGCGYMTHHREHMGCVRAAKQHTRPAPSAPATPEPVDFPAGAIVNGRTLMDRIEAYPFESEGGDLRMCSDWHELRRCFEHLADYVSTNPAPSVPDDVVRDAARYRFIRDADVSDDLIPDIALYAMESLDEYIDAAMLAAK